MIRTGLAQMDILWEDIHGNERKVRDFFDRAKALKLDMLVFPEMTLTGFSMNVKKTTRDWERQPELFRSLSKEYEMAVVCGYAASPQGINPADNKEESNLCTNHLAIYDKGELLMDYTKIHPFSYGEETEYFQGGDKVCICRYDDTVLGAFICYDLRFPEIFQCSSDYSEIIFVIANWPRRRIRHWDILLEARAIENQCYIVGVNRSGSGDGLEYCGHSVVYTPDGKALTPLCEEEELLVAEIDPACVRAFREVFPAKKDRKKDLYGKLKVSS